MNRSRTDKKRTPVIIGASQYTQPKDTRDPLDPLGLIIKTSRAALADSGAEDLGKLIDRVCFTNIYGWSYKDAPGQLSNVLGLNAENKVYANIGGNMPQKLVNNAANTIACQESSAVLIAGGEAEYSIRKAKNEGITLNWPERETPAYMEPGKDYFGYDIEQHYGLVNPIIPFVLLETALRASSGKNHDEYFSYFGAKLERFSQIASKNPYAWNRTVCSAEEITKVTPENKYLGYPLVRQAVSAMSVDQAAAVIMTNDEVADQLGVPEGRRVYPMGGADMENVFYLSRRKKLYDSPPLRVSARLALEQADLSLNDISRFDLYSCFPCMIEIAQKELGIPEDDPRDLTVTGGLPFFGGPFNSYSLHAIVSAVHLIRKDPLSKVMVHANGGVNTKQSCGIYGTQPSPNPWGARDDAGEQQSLWDESLPEVVADAKGFLTVEAYSVDFNRQGDPEKCLVIGSLDSGGRAFAFLDDACQILDKFEEIDFVGLRGAVRFDGDTGYNIVRL